MGRLSASSDGGTHPLRRVFSLRYRKDRSRQSVHRCRDEQHLFVRDEAVAVDVVQLERDCSTKEPNSVTDRKFEEVGERTSELLLGTCSKDRAERTDELLIKLMK